MKHEIIALRRISHSRESGIKLWWDVWEIELDGIPMTARIRSNGNQQASFGNILSLSNKLVKKEQDYKLIREGIIKAIDNRYTSFSVISPGLNGDLITQLISIRDYSRHQVLIIGRNEHKST